MNLARNIAAASGFLLSHRLSRRAQFHQVRLAEKLNAANPQFSRRCTG